MNKAGQDVLVRSSDNNPSQGWKVKKGFMMDITKGTTSAQPVTLAASSVDGKTPMSLNNKMETALTPQATKGKTKDVVVLGTQGELVIVYIGELGLSEEIRRASLGLESITQFLS